MDTARPRHRRRRRLLAAPFVRSEDRRGAALGTPRPRPNSRNLYDQRLPCPHIVSDQRSQPAISVELELTLNRALSLANERYHEYATLEHLLLALTNDAVASAVMKDCKIDLGALKVNVANYIDNELKPLVIDDDRDSTLTPAVQRVVQRATLYVQDRGRDAVTGGDVLMAMFDETESPAVWLLGKQGMTQQDAANFIVHLKSKATLRRRTHPVVVRRSKRGRTDRK
jgi:ATP-dependent Clp protease ATP-binding subunit ClpA